MHVFLFTRPRRPRSFTTKEIIKQIFQHKDSDDSDIDIGDSETDDDDDADGENRSFVVADDGEMNDDVDACDDSQLINADDSQFDVDIDDQSMSSDDSVDAGPTPAKLPCLDALWSWGRCGTQRVQPETSGGDMRSSA